MSVSRSASLISSVSQIGVALVKTQTLIQILGGTRESKFLASPQMRPMSLVYFVFVSKEETEVRRKSELSSGEGVCVGEVALVC